MIEEVKRAAEDALARIGLAQTADEVRALGAELLGKRGPFATFKTGSAMLATVEEKKAAGQAVNEATTGVAARLAQRRDELGAAERVAAVGGRATRPHRGDVAAAAWSRPCGHASVGAARGRVHRARLPSRRRSTRRDRLVQLRGAQHATRSSGAQHARHVLRPARRAQRTRFHGVAHAHIARADPGDADPAAADLHDHARTRVPQRDAPTRRTSPCSTSSRVW